MALSSDALNIDADISRAFSVPAGFYTDSSIFAREKERVFRRTWQVVGHRHQLAKPGDFFTTDLFGEPLLLARGMNGELRGFYNVCRHRAGPAAQGCGSRRLFRCGYHGWTYGLDGKLIHAPEFEDVQEFDRQQFALVPLRAEEWSNLILINLDPTTAPLLQSLGQLPQQAEKFDFRSLKLGDRRVYDMKCNWKTYVDNYLEGYHLPSVHPGLNRELDYSAYLVAPYEGHVRQSSPIRTPSPGEAAARRYPEIGSSLSAEYFWIFPNWMLNCYPDHVSLNIVLPLEADHCVALFEWYLQENSLGSQAAKDAVEFSHQIQIEDVAICEVVQKNLHSRSYERGRYSVRQESGVHAFHRMYAGWMNAA